MGSEELGGKRGLGGFLHSVRDVATRVVDDTTKEISKFERTLNQARLLLSTDISAWEPCPKKETIRANCPGNRHAFLLNILSPLSIYAWTFK